MHAISRIIASKWIDIDTFYHQEKKPASFTESQTFQPNVMKNIHVPGFDCIQIITCQARSLWFLSWLRNVALEIDKDMLHKSKTTWGIFNVHI